MKHAVTLRAGGHHFVMDVNDVVEIVREGPLKRLPTTPESIEGLMNHNSRLIPVVRLARWVSSSQESADGIPHILIIRHHDRALGILVDDIVSIGAWSDKATVSDDPSTSPISDTCFFLDGLNYFKLNAGLLVAGIDEPPLA